MKKDKKEPGGIYTGGKTFSVTMKGLGNYFVERRHGEGKMAVGIATKTKTGVVVLKVKKSSNEELTGKWRDIHKEV